MEMSKNPEDIEPQPQEAQPVTMAQESREDVQSNMAFLLNEPTTSTDKDFAALHYSDVTLARPSKVWGNLPPPKSSVDKFPGTFKDPAHTPEQFLTQRAESAAYAERRGETAPAGTFTFKDFDDMGDETVTEMTQEEVFILRFTLLTIHPHFSLSHLIRN